MKASPARALQPLSLAVSTLFRGSSAVRQAAACRGSTSVLGIACPGTRLRASVLLTRGLLAVSSCSIEEDSGAANGRGTLPPPRSKKAVSWEIPWGSGRADEGRSDDQRRARTLTRRIDTLPGVYGSEDARDDRCRNNAFRVMSFNVLAQALATSKMFKYVPKGQLKKRVRAPRVLDEVARYGADIICLQECDSFDDILARLNDGCRAQGARFKGVLKKRTGNGELHGVAIIFDSKMFHLVDAGTCDFGKRLTGGVGTFVLLQDLRRHRMLSNPSAAPNERHPCQSEPRVEGREVDAGDDAPADASEGATPAAGAPVHDADANASGLFCVVTTHLYWHPDGGGVRLAQAEMLLTEVEKFLRERLGTSFASVPIILAGDFNTLPGVDVYRFLASGSCHGETVEAFTRKRNERNYRRKAEELRKARVAAADMAAQVSAVRARNAVNRVETAEDPRARINDVLVKPLASASDDGLNPQGRLVGQDSPRNRSGSMRSPKISAALPRVSAESPLPNDNSAVPASDVCVGLDDSVRQRRDGETSEEDNFAGECSSGDKSEVREYSHVFQELKSAYAAYSSVFAPQLPRTEQAGEERVCTATGRVQVGHVNLGARSAKALDDYAAGISPGIRLDKSTLEWERSLRDRIMGEPHFTTATDKFAGTLDYIWHTPQLAVRALMELPSFAQVMQDGGLPSARYPSDHVSIMAELQWKRPRANRRE